MNETPIDPETRIGAVHLTVADLAREVAFYRDRLGMSLLSEDGRSAATGTAAAAEAARLGPAGGPALFVLAERPGARRAARSTGLYHAAVLLPSRRDLARTIHRLALAGERFHGFSDHLASEAAYLADPEGNGLEIYSDRPRAEWPRDENGDYVLAVDPLDVEGLLAEADRPATAEEAAPLAPGTIVGHVHLRVSDLAAAEEFYVRTLGFEITARYDRTALFVSAGGYHHHVGLNTWQSLGAPPPPPDAAGLRHFEVLLPDARARDEVVARLSRAGVALEERDAGWLARDPSGNGVMLALRGAEIGGGGGN